MAFILRVMVDTGPTELVQPFSYRGRLHRHKSAAIHIIVIGWLYRSPMPEGRRGVFYLFKLFLPAFAEPREEGSWGGKPCVFVTRQNVQANQIICCFVHTQKNEKMKSV
jgi:hypothetical protein